MESIQQAIMRLREVRNAKIEGLVRYSAHTYSQNGQVEYGSTVLEKDVECSQALSKMLSDQLISDQEADLYGFCRIAWDHAHVGGMLMRALEELHRESVVQAFSHSIGEVERAMRLKDFKTCVDHLGMMSNMGEMDDGMKERLGQVSGELQRVLLQEVVSCVGFQACLPILASKESHDSESVLSAEEYIKLLWSCCKGVGIVDEVICGVSESLFNESIHPAMIKFSDVSKHPIGYREKVLFKILKSAAESILCGDLELIACLGKTLWGRLTELYMNHLSKDALHDHLAESFMKQVNFAKKLEAKAAKLGYLDGSSKGPIAVASMEYVREMLKTKRAKVVAKVRDALILPFQEQGMYRFAVGESLISYHGDTQVPMSIDIGSQQTGNGDEIIVDSSAMRELMRECPLGHCEAPLSVLESYKVSMDIVFESLEQTAELSDAQYSHFMTTLLRDISSLIVALTGLDMHQGQSMPIYPACLRYMSCTYVSRCFCLMSFAGPRHSFGAEGNSSHESGEDIRQLGETILQCMLTSQKAELDNETMHLCTWSQDVDVKDIIAKKKSVQRLRHIFQRLGASLPEQDIPNHVFIRVSSTLLLDVLNSVMHSIMQLHDISEELSENIPHILEDLVPSSDTNGLLDCIVIGRLGKEPSDAHTALTQELMDAVPEWLKLSKLCDMMKVPSREIAQGWEDGTLAAAGFTREELRRLICALFEDTPHRAASLSKI